jgi:hypothetical protein
MSTHTPLTTIIKAIESPTLGGGGNSPTIRGWVPTFNLVVEFFEELRTNYQSVKMEKLHTLQDFQCRPHENSQEAYMQMQRLINMIKWVIEAQMIQFWYGILEEDLRQRV